MRVALTRAAAAAAPYQAALAAIGVDAIAVAVTTTVPASATEQAALRVAARAGHDAIVVASASAARALAAALAGTVPAGAVWAVGPATAAALAEHGVAARVPQRADALGLAAELLAQAPRPRQVLVPRAEGGRDELLDALRAAGVEVDDRVAYRTVACPVDAAVEAVLADAASGRLGALIAFAPSQVLALAQLGAAPAPGCRLVAIGATTAAAWQARFGRVDAVADAPTPAGVANAVATLYPRRA
ncbi:MAG: uroporphyrinogen-III synthase [Kofleriaceae bacterium]|nr:uroporphyrinogen-III synthase [Kofleriaceae bacterium]